MIKSEVLKIIAHAKSFGFKEQADGTKLFGHTPHVAPLAWFHHMFSPITEKEIL
jgi:hypothetical protein